MTSLDRAVTTEDKPVPVDEIDMSRMPSVSSWVPRWIVDVGRDCEMGIAIDDHCFVVLAQAGSGHWMLSRWIPWQVARKLGELAETVTP